MKPKLIEQLESLYTIKLMEVKRLHRYGEGTVYELDSKNDVISLDLANCNINSLKEFPLFPKIKNLNLEGNKISDLDGIEKLTTLKELRLNFNQISEVGPLRYLEQLRYLMIIGNDITSLEPLLGLKNIEDLNVSNNKLKSLEFIVTFEKLKVLSAENNKINDVSFLRTLYSLEEVDLSYNLISNIKDSFNFQNLFALRLGDNLISTIPKEIARNFSWFNNDNEANYIYLDFNPLTFPPNSVINLAGDAVKNYYEDSEKYGHAPLSEGRVIFIGDGEAGKSSLIERTLHNIFQEGKEQTNGIKIDCFTLPHPEDQRELRFHIWDFGGQEIQHAVHKFFFTEGCLYVLVLNNRQENEPDYWLQQIESLGGSAPVLVVFNKQDESSAEIADRKYLKEKYPNIVGFYNTSCKTGVGIADFKQAMESEVLQLRTVEEQFPKNWFAVKSAIAERTSGAQHYLTYETYKEICRKNNLEHEDTQKLLIKYLSTIGAVTWFGDTYLEFMHVLSPAWITQGVYKIITGKKTARLFGQIEVGDFKELLSPIAHSDYTYDVNHYGYILSMMKKFDLCSTSDDNKMLIPSAFGKTPKVEYTEFKGDGVKLYILQFHEYMPLALIHRFTAKEIGNVVDRNYWYTGIVIKDNASDAIAMVHADKEAKRIFIRIKGENKLGFWEHIRRVFKDITSNYARLPYDEMVALDNYETNFVSYQELVNHILAGKAIYFHSKLKKDYNVGYLMGQFQTKDESIRKFKEGEISFEFERYFLGEKDKVPPFIINILNHNSPNLAFQNNIQLNIDINIINNLSSELQGDIGYLKEELATSNDQLKKALEALIQFAQDSSTARNSSEVVSKGWGRKMKGYLETLSAYGDNIKKISDGAEVLKNIFTKVQALATEFNLGPVLEWFKNNPTIM